MGAIPRKNAEMGPIGLLQDGATGHKEVCTHLTSHSLCDVGLMLFDSRVADMYEKYLAPS